MTIQDLREKNLIILECISGSKAYGLDTLASDTDIKGVFILPKKDFYSLNYIPQICNDTNDIVFYELRRFIELLSTNNPNILELLNTPKPSIIYKNPLLDLLDNTKIISKLCKNTFGKYAISQVKKARGLNKKIVNPIDAERKSILSFCYVQYNKGSIPLIQYLKQNEWDQENCGLIKIPNMKNIYGLYYGTDHRYQGIIQGTLSNDVTLSPIPKSEEQKAILYFNKEGYSTYCKEYLEYWDWVKKRNPNRYEDNIKNENNYDSKNMMHVFRLLNMAIEIGKSSEINVLRKDRDFLLSIKSGKYSYDELIEMTSKLQLELDSVFLRSNLIDKPDLLHLNKSVLEIRNNFYSKSQNK
jgi:uncharacterized protein